MSLTAALRPASFAFPGTSSTRSTQSDTSRSFYHEPSYINLSRMLILYQNLILLTPDPTREPDADLTQLQRQIQADLWSKLPYHRTKWLHNIDGARSLLLQLERSAQNIRVQRNKQNAFKDLAEKRYVIKRLRNRVEEIGREVESMGDNTWNVAQSQDGRESALEVLQRHKKESRAKSESDGLLQEGKPVQRIEEDDAHEQTMSSGTAREKLFRTSSAIRHRGEALPTYGTNTGQSTGYSGVDASEQVVLDASRTQESLTVSLVDMAVQLKQQAQKFQFSLDQDKGLLDRALDGLDRNLTGMEAASKNMAFLKRMSEGEGLWGRLKLYALIFAMWVAAILLVFVGPKLRF